MRPLLGILGGMGPLATADFLTKLVQETPANHDQEHIPYLAYCVPQIPDRPAAILHNGESPLPYMLKGITTLRQGGATAIAIACNTAHHWFDDLERLGELPIIHIADAACAELARLNITTGAVGLLSTDGTVAAGFFQQRLSARGLKCVISTPEAQTTLVKPAIDAVKAGQLAHAHTLAIAAVQQLASAGAQAIILACTETPLAIEFADHSLHAHCIDATRALARACVAWHQKHS
jgi:aspartate racemase